MDSLDIRVYGQISRDEKLALESELHKVFRSGAAPLLNGSSTFLTFKGDYPKSVDEDSRRSCTARIFMSSGPGELRRSARFFLALLNHSPHVPAVFVGTSVRNRFGQLGAAWYAERRDNWAKVASTVVKAIETGWWWIVKPVGLPVMIVDRQLHIVEANQAAQQLFGAGLVGRTYPEVVEKLSPDTSLPSFHPILQAFGPESNSSSRIAPGGISRYRDVVQWVQNAEGTIEREVIRRAQLVCFPLTSFSRVVTSVVVFYVDLSHFDRINEAAREFARAESVKALQQIIVDQVVKMDYKRARLYEFDPIRRMLLGRKSNGFHDPQKATAFESREVPVPAPALSPVPSTRQGMAAVDKEPHNTISKKYPALFIYDDSLKKEPVSDLVHYCKRARDSEDLEKNDVYRWMEVPILIPHVDEKGQTEIRTWGKISVDDGPDSDRLMPRNVADLTVLAAVAGGAMAEKLRAEAEQERSLRDKKLLHIYEEYTGKLDQAELAKSADEVMLQVKSLLLELFRDSFQLDVALYREFHPEDRTLRCRLVSKKLGSLPDDCDIPPSVAVNDYPSYAMFDARQVDDEGSVRPGASIEPFCLNRANEQIRAMLRVRIDLTEGEQRYLNWIQSEIGIPIQIGDKIRGVIVGLAHRPDAFPPEREIVLRRFRYIAALWFQLSELHGAKARAIERLGTCIKAWSLLQDVEDTKLFAGLAAILTAGCGLGWHRALIFRNGKYASSTAELVYAVGGLGEPTHGETQSATEQQERDLEAFVRKRIDDPEPHGIDAKSKEDRYDSLYLRYIKQAKRPVTVSYSDRDSEQLRPILKASGMSPPDYLCFTHDAPLIQSMNRIHPGLFPRGRPISSRFTPTIPSSPVRSGSSRWTANTVPSPSKKPTWP